MKESQGIHALYLSTGIQVMSHLMKQVDAAPRELYTPPHRLDEVWIDGGRVKIADLLDACMYVLTNTDLQPDDSRVKFVNRVSSLKEVQSYSHGGMRLAIPEEVAEPSGLLA